MGFFSYTCAKTNLPVLASTSWGENEYSRIHLISRDGSIVNGYYDGYGRVDLSDGGTLEDIDEGIMSGHWKIVLSKFYHNEKYQDLENSRTDPGQGHFHDSDQIQIWHKQKGFASYQDYIKALRAPYESKPQQ